jgi:hypothetical protein
MYQIHLAMTTIITSPLIFLYWLVGWFMVRNANFNNISVLLWQSVLLVEETEVSGENHRPATSH